jgi:trehalose 6-phosphate phosphatase
MILSAPDAPPPPDLLADASLFLDFDGTLVELLADPGLTNVNDHLVKLMESLALALDGRVAIISGRPVETIRALFPIPLPVLAGSHGLEIVLPDGVMLAPERHGALDRIASAMRDFISTRPGLLIEEKPFGVALHYRRAAHEEERSHALANMLAEETGFHVQTGKMMVELRIGGADKGSALRRLMEVAPMAGHRPVFIGDDDTDEPGMAAAADLGGAAILVGASRPSAAAYRLPDVAATLGWLEAAAGAAR